MGDNAKVVVSHDLDRALVLGQRVIEGDFLLREPFLLAPLVRGSEPVNDFETVTITIY